MSVPMVYPTYGLDEDSHAPCTEIKVDPLVEKNIDNDLNDQEDYDEDFDDEFKDPNWNLPKGKKKPVLRWNRVFRGGIRE